MKNLDKYDFDTKMDKFDYEAKVNQDKKDNERRKVILIIIMDYLVNMGYSGAAAYLQTESGFDIDKYSVAANMDLDFILYEFEEFFKMKHKNRAPVFIIKKDVLPQINIKRDSNIKKTPKPKVTDKSAKKTESEKTQVDINIPTNGQGSNIKMEIVGQNIYQTNNNYNLNNYGNVPNAKNKPNEKNEKTDKVSFNDQKER